MRRKTCRACESSALELILNLGEMVLAGAFLPNAEAIESERKFPLDIYVCNDCSLVQILEVVDPNILFQDYSFASSTVGPLVQHFTNYASWLKTNLDPRLVVEFGCNDGILLGPLESLGIKAYGIDHSENITALARSKGLTVITGGFTDVAAQSVVDAAGHADVVTGSNAFAHNDRPELILNAARKVLKPGGHLVLEVMYAGDLLEQWQWDTLYHEHLTFYCLATLRVLLNRFGFHVVDAERIPMHGGSLRVVAAMDPQQPPSVNVDALRAYEDRVGLSNPATWRAFGQAVGRKIRIVDETVGRLSRSSRIWAFGAAGKATLWVNACRMNYLEAMVDASPLRAGKLMPGTHTPIVSPEELKKSPPDYIFVTAWNYADLIKSKEPWYQGTWLTPLPDLRFF